jgi:hypothetical protein
MVLVILEDLTYDSLIDLFLQTRSDWIESALVYNGSLPEKIQNDGAPFQAVRKMICYVLRSIVDTIEHLIEIFAVNNKESWFLSASYSDIPLSFRKQVQEWNPAKEIPGKLFSWLSKQEEVVSNNSMF